MSINKTPSYFNIPMTRLKSGFEVPTSSIRCKESFSKIELNQDGAKLAFFDNNVLGRLLDGNITEKEKIEFFKLYKLRPVLGIELKGELIKGLCKNSKYLSNKKAIARFLEKSGALWICEHQFLEAYELYNLNKGIEAHSSFKVFFNAPVGAIKLNPWESIIYEGMDFKFNFYESVYTGKGLEGFIEELFEDRFNIRGELIRGAIKSIRSTITVREKLCNAINEEKALFLCQSEMQHINVILRNHTDGKMSLEQITKIINKLDEREFLKRAPYFLTYKKIYETIHLRNKNNHIEKAKQQINSFIDDLHLAIALSYCDMFIVNDRALKRKAIELKNLLNLNVTIYGFDTVNFKLIKT